MPELTPKEKRALREQARREFRAAERARLEREAGAAGSHAAKGAAPPASSGQSPAAALPPDRTDKERAADAATFLRGVVWPVLGLLAALVGRTLPPLSEGQAAEDGRAWVPLARRYPALDLLFTWAAAPARLIARVRELAQKREPPPTKEPAP